MRALVLTANGGLDGLAVADLPRPGAPPAGWVTLQVRAAALNRLDLFVAVGIPGAAPVLPHIVGAAGAGVVVEVGAAVTSAKPGDEVMFDPGISCGECAACRADDAPFCTTYQILGEHRHGSAAEFIQVPAANLAPRPAGWGPWSALVVD